MTGRHPNPLADACDRAVAVDAESAATVQEVQQVLVHVLAQAVDGAVAPPRWPTSPPRRRPPGWRTSSPA